MKLFLRDQKKTFLKKKKLNNKNEYKKRKENKKTRKWKCLIIFPFVSNHKGTPPPTQANGWG